MKWFVAFVLAVFAIAPIGYLAYDMVSQRQAPPVQVKPEVLRDDLVEFEQQTPEKVEVGAKFKVLAAKVVEGHIFGLFLDGDNWIEAHLCVATKEEATQVVVNLLKSKQISPTVTLKRKVGNVWYVDFIMNVDGKQVDLVNYLQQKDLLL